MIKSFKNIEPGHIGIVIKEELIEAYNVTVNKVGDETGISVKTLTTDFWL